MSKYCHDDCIVAPGDACEKEWDIVVKLFSKHGVVLIGFLCIFAGASNVLAFSIGDFQVHSKFGEKFNASFEIALDFDGPVEVGLGSVKDYGKLGLERQDIIDALLMSTAQPGKGLRKTVQIHSNNPLFFPSFNLVVWSTHNGGTLLENFLVTVDFQQSLALNIGGKKKKSGSDQSLPNIPSRDSSVGSEAPRQAEQLEKKAQGSQQNEGISVRPETPVKASKPVFNEGVVAEKSNDEAEVVSIEAKAPVPAQGQIMHRRRLSGVIWAQPRPVLDYSAISSNSKKAEKVEATASDPSPPSNRGYVLKKGEGLFSIARKLKIENYHPAQIAVAIWMHNIDKFIFGNINGIQEGVKLNLENLESHLSGVGLRTAKRILRNQTIEWKLTKNVTSIVEDPSEKTISGIPLPTERLEDIEKLFEQVNGWQTTWENMDVDGHLAYYQKGENSSSSNKKRFLASHIEPRLETSSKTLMFKNGAAIVFFEQKFYSDTLKSEGMKEMEWARTDSGWKIRAEDFFESETLLNENLTANQAQVKNTSPAEKNHKRSFVIHVSSHAKESKAISVANRLRENGYDGYWISVRISKEVQIYRVYVGRFANWSQAHRVVKVLRNKPFGGHSTAIPYPFALQVGEVKSLVEAKILLESLRKSELSGLLLVTDAEATGISFRVVVGAFKKEANATWMFQRLKQSGFDAKLISP